MFRIGDSLATLEKRVDNFAIEALCGQLQSEWVTEVLEETHWASQRVRALPADLVVVRSKRRLKIKKRRKLGSGDWLVEAILPDSLRRAHPEPAQTLDSPRHP